MTVPFDKRQEGIEQLNLRPELVELLLEKDGFAVFSNYFKKPEYFYSKGYPDKPGDWFELGDRELLPLWEYSDEIFVIDLKSKQLISFFLECPEEYEVIETIDRALFDVIVLHTWEIAGEDKEICEAVEFAKKVKLPNLAGLEKLFTKYHECTEEMIAEYRETL